MTEQGGFTGDETEPIRPNFSPSNVPPAGWYPVDGEQRYWDGIGWTEHRAPAAGSPYYGQGYYGQGYEAPLVITDARSNNSVEIVIAWIFTVVSLGYMFPWAIAATRGKSNSWAVGLLTFFLGWTFVAWFAALVLACLPHQRMLVHYRS